MTFTEKLVLASCGFTLVIIGGAFKLMYDVNDISALSELLIGVFAMNTACLSFFFWKRRAENVIKLRKEHGMELTEGIDDNDD